jgi:YD repeat-containing protein
MQFTINGSFDPWFRLCLPALGDFSCALAVLAASGPALAGVLDCMGNAPDGTAKCTKPVVPPTFTYGVCIANNLSTTENASTYCSGVVGTLTGDAKIVEYINCVGFRLYNQSGWTSSVNWKPSGASDSNAANLCGPYTVVSKYGAELQGFDRQDLYYSVFPTRSRTPECPPGYSPVSSGAGGIDYCIKPAASCSKVGNPLTVATAEKAIFETDYPGNDASPLVFQRSYSNLGYYRPMNGSDVALAGFGDFWRHTYDRRVYAENAPYLMATAVREDGTERHFRSDGKDVLNIEGGSDTLAAITSGSQVTGWRYRKAGGELESYDAGGRLISIRDARGRSQTLTYSDATTPPAIAPYPGLLLSVADNFARSLAFTYDGAGRMRTLTVPDGGVYTYSFDNREMLTSVAFPDARSRTYTYNETSVFASAGGPWAISGIYDENNARFATYRYRDAYWGTPDSTEHANGVEKFVRMPAGPDVVTVTDPLLTNRTFTFQTVNGASRLVAQSQPAGSGCNASSSAIAYDTAGNVSSTDDFNAHRSCHAYDPSRNLETVRVEGLASSATCGTYVTANVALPSGSRKVTTQWHPDWRMETQRSEPGRRTTWVYNGQPDPLSGNAIASCAPASALLPDGKPIAVLCKKVEQATTDIDGSQGNSSVVTIPPVGADPFFSSVSLLLHMNGANAATTFTDSSSNALALTSNGNAQLSTAQFKFSSASGKFDGTTDWLDASAAALNLSGGDYTIELWTLLPSVGATQIWYSQFPTGIDFGVDPGGDVYFQPAGGAYINTGAGGLAAGAWQHVAVARSGSVTRLFVNGSLKASSSGLAAAGSSSALSVGARYANHLFSVTGYIDDLRVTKGVARYTSEFIAPTAAFGDSVAGSGGSVVPMINASVPARVQSWTYNAYGQVLTAKGARTDVNDTTTFAYYSSTTIDHTLGDLQSKTNAVGKVTQFTKYNKNGQWLESIDPNGVLTVNTYDQRQRLKTTSVGGQATSYTYDPAGQLTRITQPDASYIGYEYDDAHRVKAVFDNKSNRIEYTLDNAGNRITENVKDPSGNLKRQFGRSIDALGRVQQSTGRE